MTNDHWSYLAKIAGHWRFQVIHTLRYTRTHSVDSIAVHRSGVSNSWLCMQCVYIYLYSDSCIEAHHFQTLNESLEYDKQRKIKNGENHHEKISNNQIRTRECLSDRERERERMATIVEISIGFYRREKNSGRLNWMRICARRRKIMTEKTRRKAERNR